MPFRARNWPLKSATTTNRPSSATSRSTTSSSGAGDEGDNLGSLHGTDAASMIPKLTHPSEPQSSTMRENHHHPGRPIRRHYLIASQRPPRLLGSTTPITVRQVLSVSARPSGESRAEYDPGPSIAPK